MAISEEASQVDVAALVNHVRELLARVSELEARLVGKDEVMEPGASGDKEDNLGPGPEEDKKPPWHVRLVINRRDPASRNGVRKDFEEAESPLTKKSKPKEAAIFRIFISDFQANEEGTERGQLKIFNEGLRELLKKSLSHHPTHEFYGENVTLESPFEALILNWDLLKGESEKVGSTPEDKVARRALRRILDLLQQNAGDGRLNDYFRNREATIRSSNITYDTLWTIFPPGTLLYGRPFLNQDQVFIVKGYGHRGLWPDPKKDGWKLGCWTYDWNGRDFRRRFLYLTIPAFSGYKPITALPYFPLEMAEHKDEIKRNLIERGRRYRGYCTAQAGKRRFRYNGRAIVDMLGFRWKDEAILRHLPPLLMSLGGRNGDSIDASAPPKEALVNGDVMVDFGSYYQYGPQQSYLGNTPLSEVSHECICEHCANNPVLAETYYRAFDEATEENEKKWDDLQYMLLPPRLLGYALREKQWAQFDIGCLEPVRDDGDAFQNRLHLKGDNSFSEEEIKKLLQDLVSTHGQDQLADLVADKGQSLVILLYGRPGVGKTSTAETLAAAAKKPLFSIGVGDVGTEAKNVESNLRRIFDLATRWKAILLIDEVDVFVQSRGMGHQGPTTERNALVSVFLRVLEYYQGILILTTNQIALFDIAVQSRIHIALKYTDLDKPQAIQIFESFLDQYHNKALVGEYDAIKKYLQTDIAKKGFDGRQLRNIVSSAMGRALARENGKLKQEDVETIIRNMESFKTDLEYQMRRYQGK